MKRIAADSQIDEPLRDISVDKDTKNVPGSPRIFETILSKIERASAFVADLTFCGNRVAGGPVPNPNVLVEYGYALKELGENCLVSVMNSAHGEPNRENMPFDLLNRRFPISYRLPDDASDDEVRTVRKQLSKDFEGALRAIFESEDFKKKSGRSPSASEQFEPRKPAFGEARFRSKGEALGFAAWGGYDIFLDEGPAMWLRVMPVLTPNRTWLLGELEERIQQQLMLATLIDYGPGNLGTFKSEDGCGSFPVTDVPRDGKISVQAATTMFETGEIWTVATFAPLSQSKCIPLDSDRYAYCLNSCSDALEKAGLPKPFRWMAGAEGIKGWRLTGQRVFNLAQGGCLTDKVSSEGTLAKGQSPKEALRPFFAKLFDQCGRKWDG